MAESMQGLKRTHRCTEVSAANVGETVTVMGWVAKQRNKGGIIFVDLRDRSGILQLIFEEDKCGSENFAKAEKLRSEFVVAVVGRVEKRAGAVNENLATGDIEIIAEQIRILSEAETPPFPIEENSKTKEEMRLKYRYLDLRRPDLQRNLILRSKICTEVRAFMANEGFLEIETPICKTTVKELKGKKMAIVPILRAGLGMVDGMLSLIPAAKIGHIGLYRDPETLKPVEYYCKLPADCAEREVFVVDPMLATGGSSVAAIQMLKDKGCQKIHFMCIIAAPEGVKAMQEAHPDVDIYIGALDEKLNEHGYIVPGLGDAGDRIFGTK